MQKWKSLMFGWRQHQKIWEGKRHRHHQQQQHITYFIALEAPLVWVGVAIFSRKAESDVFNRNLASQIKQTFDSVIKNERLSAIPHVT